MNNQNIITNAYDFFHIELLAIMLMKIVFEIEFLNTKYCILIHKHIKFRLSDYLFLN